ncbi:MAG: DUF2971 domain-containing protein [Bacteroidales bacterium]|nr:DUF2971 domain-containing protein [Bacteroidales bacterium]
MEEKAVKSLEIYINNYLEKVTVYNAQQCMKDFDENWKTITDETPKRQSKYGLALVIFSVANYELSNISEKNISFLSNLIYQYDKNEDVKYKFGIKQSLFFNLGLCWHKLGKLYDGRAIEAFKKYVFYIITQSSRTSYRPTAYAFRKCTTFLYQSLVNEQLNLSSPTTFNDPFDCPIRVLLYKGNDVSSLVRQAYQDCLKIACFSSNVKLPYPKDTNNPLSESVFDEKKHRKDKKEYLNSLMWGHYADSHKGICIKYSFNNSISLLGSENPNIVAYFKDVKYSNGDMSKYSNKDSITLEDAFFLKGKQWEYENELRFLYYDLNGNSDYGTIDIPSCIEAIYFGLKCSNKDKETIQNIMRSKRFIRKDLNGKELSNSAIQFYQMELDYKHFGQLKAVRLK